MTTKINYTGEAKELLGEFVLRAGKNFLVIRATDVFQQPTTIKVTPDNLAEFYSTQAGNLLSGCRTLAGLTGDWRPISGLADTCLSWFKRVNIEAMRRAARKRGLAPRF
jgi:hypothetical protein